jgi:dTDP-4-amino-4,6-dideoxygalactose transaminase
MRNHGANAAKSIPTDVEVWGTNSRLDNIHAAILNYKLTYYAEAIDRRRQIAARYHHAFHNIAGLRLPPPPSDGAFFDIYQNFEICANDRSQRDELRTWLDERSVGTIVQWGGFGIHQLRGLGFTQDCPKTDEFFETSLLLPMNHILTEAQIDHVIESVSAFFHGCSASGN